ncbi:MAG: hypothetical protein VYC43_00195 [Pseudomonadota bacterium]|nr:hypothetical protein [Pseudomonadota bacterium]MEC9382673.1 hypothetical protein [Pseudomonadota bacterium]MEC9413975.1 hypothetical protein [Pseudomonadota bacterium]|tara:strand:+ start:1761 stop:1895 length:135 start_codon:yes stop_codon:yes gene_type:complete
MKKYIIFLFVFGSIFFLVSYIEKNGQPEIKEIKKVLNEKEIFID